jgi:hypothetical protein
MPLIDGRRMPTHVEQGPIHGVGAAIGRSGERGDVVGAERSLAVMNALCPAPENLAGRRHCGVGGVGEANVCNGRVLAGEDPKVV